MSCACVSVMAGLVFANVIARKVFNNSLTISDEMPNYLFVLMSFMGTAIAARRKAHLGLSSVAAILVQGTGKPVETIMSVLPRLCSSASSKFVLLAIPFFILSGNVMEKAGYSAPFSCALMAAGGAIGVVIPSSITFVVFGSIAEGASITDLFISGLVPGLLMGGGLIVVSLVLGRKMDLKVMPKSSSLERWQALKDAFWGLLMPVIILGGIYGGIFTPTEAAAVSVFYSLIVGVFVYREINLKKMIDILIDSCSTTATVIFITMGATLFSYVLTRARLDLAIGLFTPPVGGNLYVACGIGDIPFADLVKKIIPFLLVLLFGLLLITYVEDVTLFIPRILGYQG